MFNLKNKSRITYSQPELKLNSDLLPIVFVSSRHDAKPMLAVRGLCLKDENIFKGIHLGFVLERVSAGSKELVLVAGGVNDCTDCVSGVFVCSFLKYAKTDTTNARKEIMYGTNLALYMKRLVKWSYLSLSSSAAFFVWIKCRCASKPGNVQPTVSVNRTIVLSGLKGSVMLSSFSPRTTTSMVALSIFCSSRNTRQSVMPPLCFMRSMSCSAIASCSGVMQKVRCLNKWRLNYAGWFSSP